MAKSFKTCSSSAINGVVAWPATWWSFELGWDESTNFRMGGSIDKVNLRIT
jgi:hypothetical protein